MHPTLLLRKQPLAASAFELAARQLERNHRGISTTRQFLVSPSKFIVRSNASIGKAPIKSGFVYEGSPPHGIFGTPPRNNQTWRPAISHIRPFFASAQRLEAVKIPKEEYREAPTTNDEHESKIRDEVENNRHGAVEGFGQSEKASLASQVNLSARLSGSQTPNAAFSEVWRLVKIAWPEAKWLTFAFVCLVTSSAITMSIPLSIGRILDTATNGSVDKLFGLTLNQFYIALGSLLTLGAAANYGRVILLRIVGERIVARLRSTLYRKTYVQDAEFFDANRTGDLISRLSSDTVIVGKSITQNLSDGLRALVTGGAGLTAMAMVSLKLTSLLMIMLPPIAITSFLYGRVIRNISKSIQKNLGTLTKIAEERLGNVRTSQAFAAEIQEVSRYNKQVKEIFGLGKREALVSATYFSSTGFLGNMTILLLLSLGGSMVKNGVISIGELTSFLLYAAYTGGSMIGVTSFWSELMKGVGAATRLFELQDRKPKLSITVGTPVKSAQGPIKFSNVSFAYPTRPAVKIFNGLDFEIPSGSNVAIVGPSGGGKSTISSLLLRFYLPTSGSISINGTDILTMNGKSLRRRIGVVSQEPVLMSGTIAENISYGKPRATEAEITAAARKANCGFISDFPDGLQTFVGARGAQLSGGQKQRIAIARALLKEPDILILDEATSALDAESETLVNSALAALLKGHNTTISIAHRLSTIKRSDQLIVLGTDGRVAEQGTYKDLSSDPDSAFSKLMEWQMSGGDAVPDKVLTMEGHVLESEEIADDLMRHDDEDANGVSETQAVADKVAEAVPTGKRD